MESNRTSQEERAGFQLIASSDDDFGAGWKICSNCNTDQPLDNFWVEAKGRSGRKAVCKNCLNKTHKVKRPAKRGEIPLKTIRNAVSKVTNDRIQQALEAAAYRIIKESM